MAETILRNTRMPGVLFSLLVLLLTVVGWWLQRTDATSYYQLVQEDGPLEWATFWAFLLACGVWLRLWRAGSGFWCRCYLGGMALTSLVCAFEEISWGQRVFGYQAPEVFLSNNFQQELNLHNFAEAGLRKAAVLMLLTGYGVLLPLLAVLRWPRAWFERLGVVVPALPVVPGFAAAAGLYLLYPWHNTGEWVELFAGLGLLAVATSLRPSDESGRSDATAGVSAGVGGVLLGTALLAGLLTPRLIPTTGSAIHIAVAVRETEALAQDFRHKRLRARCGVHMRVYSFVSEYGARRMAESDFGRQADDAAARNRKHYFLDPWQMPYWIRHQCTADGVTAFVYSFGPDRRRQSTPSGIAGDDVGAYITGGADIPRTPSYQPLQRGQTATTAAPPSTTR